MIVKIFWVANQNSFPAQQMVTGEIRYSPSAYFFGAQLSAQRNGTHAILTSKAITPCAPQSRPTDPSCNPALWRCFATG